MAVRLIKLQLSKFAVLLDFNRFPRNKRGKLSLNDNRNECHPVGILLNNGSEINETMAFQFAALLDFNKFPRNKQGKLSLNDKRNECHPVGNLLDNDSEGKLNLRSLTATAAACVLTANKL